MLRELDEAARALTPPRVVLFDWHATLVDTLDAMYHAVDDALLRFPELGIRDSMVSHDQCNSVGGDVVPHVPPYPATADALSDCDSGELRVPPVDINLAA